MKNSPNYNSKSKSCPCFGAPAVVVCQTIDGIKGLSNCFVFVTSINTCFFVDSSHLITIISAGPVYVDNYDVVANPLGLRNQTLYDFAKNIAVHYNAHGEYRVSELKEVA